MDSPVAFFKTLGILFACSLLIICVYLWRMFTNRTLHVQQRQAKFTLLVFIVSLVDYAILAGILRFPWEPSISIMGLFGLVAFSSVIGHAESREGKVIVDERDREINMTATAAGFGIFWACLCVAWTIWFWVLGPDGIVTIGIGRLGLVLPAGMVIISSIRALATLLMHRRDARAEAN